MRYGDIHTRIPGSGTPTPAPGEFTFNVLQLGENVLVAWNASSGATSYEIYRDDVLVHTEPVPGDLFYSVLATIGGSFTMFAVNGGGSTASSSNPQVA